MQTEIFIQAPTCGPREAGAKLADCLRCLQSTKTFGLANKWDARSKGSSRSLWTTP